MTCRPRCGRRSRRRSPSCVSDQAREAIAWPTERSAPTSSHERRARAGAVRRLRYERGMFGNGAAGASYGDLLITSLVVLAGVCVAAFVVVRLVGRWLATARSRGADIMAVV